MNHASYWHNFRAFRAAVVGKPAAERKKLAALYRAGPYVIVFDGIASAMAFAAKERGDATY